MVHSGIALRLSWPLPAIQEGLNNIGRPAALPSMFAARLVWPRVCLAHCIPCALPCARQASTANSQQTSSKSSSLHVSVDSAEAAAAADAAKETFAMSERLVDQQLRPEDIQLADGPDGKPFLLGKGGFGEVRHLQRCSGVPGRGQGYRTVGAVAA